MKKVTVALAALAAVGFAGAAMAENNPWAPGQTTVPVTITVEEIAEVWTNTAPVNLVIQNGGTNHGAANAVTRDLFHLSNANIQVSASIGGNTANIPNDSSFLVLVNPANPAWTSYDQAGAQSVLRWTKTGSSFTSGAIGTPQHAFNAGPAADAVTKTVQYFAYSDGPLSQDIGTKGFDLIWTVAAGGSGS